jgi:hypothetical protein
MKLRSLCTAVGIGALALTTTSVPGFSQDTNSNNTSDEVTFSCDRAGKESPATVAWIPQREKYVYIINWKRPGFKQWTPSKRCELVSARFQDFQKSGQLQFLATGVNNGYPVICAVKSQEETCNRDNQLFTLRSNSDASQVLERMNNILVGASSQPIVQSSKERKFLNMAIFLQHAPDVNGEK